MDKLKVMLMLLGFENTGKIYASDRYKLEHIRLHFYATYVAVYHKIGRHHRFQRHYFTNDSLFPNDLIGRIKDDLKNYNKEVS